MMSETVNKSKVFVVYWAHTGISSMQARNYNHSIYTYTHTYINAYTYIHKVDITKLSNAEIVSIET